MKSYQKNIFYLLSGTNSLFLSFLTLRGTLQKHINFEGIPSEIAFCLFTAILGIGLIFTGIPTRHFRKLRNKLFPFTISFKINIEKRYHPSGISMKAWKNYTNKNKNQ